MNAPAPLPPAPQAWPLGLPLIYLPPLPCRFTAGIALFEKYGVEFKDGDDPLHVLSTLPITNYDDYRATMDAIVEAGEAGVSDEEFLAAQHKIVSNDRMFAIITTSGTTGGWAAGGW